MNMLIGAFIVLISGTIGMIIDNKTELPAPVWWTWGSLTGLIGMFISMIG